MKLMTNSLWGQSYKNTTGGVKKVLRSNSASKKKVILTNFKAQCLKIYKIVGVR